MARQKNKRTRTQEYRARRTKSWLGFLTKILMFAIPVIAVTVWLIVFLLGQGQALPVLTLDFKPSSENRSEHQVWNRLNYRLNKTNGIELPEEMIFGGPNNDVVFVFNDLLGSAKPIADSGQAVACIFEPSNDEEHQTHAFRGLRTDDTTAESSQWVPFESYLQKTIDAIAKSKNVADQKNGWRGKIVFVLDVDHPDLPGHLPPQSNEFIGLCKTQWEKTARDQLNQDFDVFVWLSHSEGQMSYYDSNTRQVESFFKRRFDNGITGDVINLNGRVSSRNTIFYSDLKKYMKQWIESDSNIHKLAQTPTFLEPAASSDFEALRFGKNPAEIDIFDYQERKDGSQIQGLWQAFETAKEERDWKFENPLLVQRSLMLLLQLEKLWYVGKQNSILFDDLKNELDALVKTATTIEPIQHSLYDVHDDGQVSLNRSLDLNWLTPQTPATATPPTGTEPADQKTAEQFEEERLAALTQWRNQSPGWPIAKDVWRTFSEKLASQQQLKSALEQLSDGQRLIPLTERSTEIEKLAALPWNEIGYLQRLANELAWPSNANALANFQTLIRASIQARDHANRFMANLSPALVGLKFRERFEELENQRRFLEDRLFANDHSELQPSFEKLSGEYQLIARQHDKLKTEFETIQQQLIHAPHDLRYSLESLATQAQNGGNVTSRTTVVSQFDEWLNKDGGFESGWSRLGKSQMLGALSVEGDAQQTSVFKGIREGGFPNRGSARDNSKGFASNPYLDFADFSSTGVNMGNADGNLLARRLLLWPGLDLATRETIRDGLQTKSVGQSGNTDEKQSNETQPEFDFNNSEITHLLGSLFQKESVDLLTNIKEPIKFEQGDENFFIRVAFDAHRLLIQREDATAENLVVAINDFRSKKSDLAFRNVASDLWGTPKSSDATFVVASLRNHNNLVNNRLQVMPGLERIRNRVTEVWNSDAKQKWPARIETAETFSKGFLKWSWEHQAATNDLIAAEIKNEKNLDNEMMFALSPREYNFDSVTNDEFDFDKRSLNPGQIKGDSLRIYLRGHQDTIAITKPAVEAKPVFYSIGLNADNSARAQILVSRAGGGTISGHITLVIDCSRSMGVQGMNQAKADVVEFLNQISKRGDISVSLVAIGAADYWNSKLGDRGDWENRPSTDLASWQKDPKNDVWVYEFKWVGKREAVNEQSIAGFTKAISELKPFGETPIMSGLEKALSLRQEQGSQAKLVVLLTDGFEFQNNRDRNAPGDFAPFDRALYDQLRGKFNSGTELVNFSFLKDDVTSAFKTMIDGGVSEDEIRRRIKDIESLATINKKASQTSLKEFFAGLLPQPLVFVEGDGEPKLQETIRVTDGTDVDNNGRLSNEEQRIMAAIRLKATDRPKNWSVGIDFRQTNNSNAARSFSKELQRWTSSTRIFGNETLKFVYDPGNLKPFDLTTASMSDAAAKELKLDGQELLVGKTSNRLLEPAFEIGSRDSSALTPAPALAFLTFYQRDNPEQSVLIQDFNLLQQQTSNVHPLEFPVFSGQHRRAVFNRNPVNFRLHLVPNVPPSMFAKLQFSDQDPWTLKNEGDEPLTIKPLDYVKVNELLPNPKQFKQFNDYSIEIRRPDSDDASDVDRDFANANDYAYYWIRIRPEVETMPVDRWLVQILGADGQLDRNVKRKSHRKYTYRENADGTQTLIYIEHHFTINKSELRKSKAYFGFANIDALKIEVGKLDYEAIE